MALSLTHNKNTFSIIVLTQTISQKTDVFNLKQNDTYEAWDKEKKNGQFLVEQKLKQHKIDSQTIEEIVSKLYKDYPSADIISEIIKKSWGW